jgi:5-methyltetrahydrofolate--homocysteine methyltransferase
MKTVPDQALAQFTARFLDFQIDAMPAEADRLVAAGVTLQAFLQACRPCMEVVGEKFEAGEYYLPQLVAAGEMFKVVSARLQAAARSGDGAPGPQEAPPLQGEIVLGTPQGDIHDLGKNIFSILAQASGFTVHDLGVDVAPATFLDKLAETGATVLGMSALLTTTFDAMRSVVALLEKGGLRRQTYVIIGGGATEAGLVEKLGVDAQTWDAYTGVKCIRAFVGRGCGEAAA